MARRRLNKKVAIIGSVVFLGFLLAVILVVLKLSQSPEKFIADGDRILQQAREAVDPNMRKELYESAARNYHRARNRTKTDAARADILLKLADLYLEIDEWQSAIGCLTKIVHIDPDNIKARMGRLQYFYAMADSGIQQVWPEIQTQASEFLSAVNVNDLSDTSIKKYYIDKIQKFGVDMDSIDDVMHYLVSRGMLYMVQSGATTNQEQMLETVISNLEQLADRYSEPVIYSHLAEAYRKKGDILAGMGRFDEKAKINQKMLELLDTAVAQNADDPNVYIYRIKTKMLMLSPDDQDQFKAIKQELIDVVDKFPASPQAHSLLALYYQNDPNQLDQAIESINRSRALQPEKVFYATESAHLYYRRYLQKGDPSDFESAVEIATQALEMEGTQDKPGPRQRANIMNRFQVYSFLAYCYIEELYEPQTVMTDVKRQSFLEKAEQAVHEIRQFLGSAEVPLAIMWQGMLEMVEGQEKQAVQKLYEAYQKMKASNERDMRLSYMLARYFENTSELGAATEFYASALSLSDRQSTNKIDLWKPTVLVDYAELLFRRKIYQGALNIVDFYERRYAPDSRSKILRIQATIASRQFEKANELIDSFDSDLVKKADLRLTLSRERVRQYRRLLTRQKQQQSEVYQNLADTLSLESESDYVDDAAGELQETPEDRLVEESPQMLKEDWMKRNEMLASNIKDMIAISPNSVNDDVLMAVCTNYLLQEKLDVLQSFVDEVLPVLPESVTLNYYRRLLREPNPTQVPRQRQLEIEKQAIMEIQDSQKRAMALGLFCRRRERSGEAIEHFEEVLRQSSRNGQQTYDNLQLLASEYIFDAALYIGDYNKAQQMALIAREYDIDNCEGLFFEARIAASKQEYDESLAKLNECLSRWPVFSRGYLLRSRINSYLGNHTAAVEDAFKALSLSPNSGVIARRVAYALYQRNQQLGETVTPEQKLQTKTAFERALSLNRADRELMLFYANYIREEDPTEAIAISQRLYKVFPTIENALNLAQMAMAVSERNMSQEKRNFLYNLAHTTLLDARQKDPNNVLVVTQLAEYYRTTGAAEQGEQLLQETANEQLLWRYYYQLGQYEQAKAILNALYQEKPEDRNLIKGLALIADKTGDMNGMESLTNQLVQQSSDIEDHLWQIQLLLKNGLLPQAEKRLDAFGQAYPDEKRALLLDSWLAMRKGDLSRALAVIEEYIQTDESNATAWQIRGEIHRFLGDYDQSILDLRRSCNLEDRPNSRLALAKSLIANGRNREAITELKAVVADPQVPQEAWLLLEQVYWKTERVQDLRSFYTDVIDAYPNSLFWLGRMGEFALRTNDVQAAKAIYGRALQVAQQIRQIDPMILDGYFRTLLLSEQYNKLFEEAGEFVDGPLASIAYFRMGESKWHLGDKESAVTYFRKSLEKTGGNEDLASNILVQMYNLLGIEEVQKYCEEKLEKSPDSYSSNLIMFNLMKIKGDMNNALRYLDRCLDIIGPEGAQRVQFVAEKASILNQLYYQTSDTSYMAKAVDAYESLLEKMPNNVTVLNNLAYLLADNDRQLDKAQDYAKQACNIMPNNASFLDTYAYVLYKAQQYKEAEKLVMASIQHFEQNGALAPVDVYEHLGMINEKLNKISEAISAYEQALTAGAQQLSDERKAQLQSTIDRLSDK